jgi:hypothetical protein
MKEGTITLNWMKRQSLEWHHPASPWKNKFNVTSSARKVMATVSMGCRRGNVGIHYARRSIH